MVADGASIVQPVVTLQLDAQGVIRNVSLSRALSRESTEGWIGRPWVETVGELAVDHVKKMVEDARDHGVSAFRQVTQCFPSGLEVPMEYTTVRLGRKAGLIAVGKSLQAVSDLQSRLIAAQVAMERDYWKFRDIETRYRLLFDSSNEAVLLVRASDLRVVEANPASIRAFGIAPADREFLSELPPSEREGFKSMLSMVRDQGRAPAVVAHLGPAGEPWVVRASLMNSEPGPSFMLQLSRTQGPERAEGPERAGLPEISFDQIIEQTPDGFAIVDARGVILRGNRALVDLTQAGSSGALVGERLGRWLNRPGADMTLLLTSMERNGVVRLFPTKLTGDLGTTVDVEISGVAIPDAGPAIFGLVVRDVSRRLPGPESGLPEFRFDPASDQIGSQPLQALVKDATEAVERHYIEGALSMMKGNRTAAAELLGLSRQSLYVKLHRYGFEDENSRARQRTE